MTDWRRKASIIHHGQQPGASRAGSELPCVKKIFPRHVLKYAGGTLQRINEVGYLRSIALGTAARLAKEVRKGREGAGRTLVLRPRWESLGHSRGVSKCYARQDGALGPQHLYFLGASQTQEIFCPDGLAVV